MSTRPKILLVDDRPENLLALEAQLRPLEAQFLRAGSGREALDLLLQHEVAAAIVDVQMPEMDGFELAEMMRGSPRTKTIPLIFVTAGLHDRARVFKGYEAGAVDFLIKPVEPQVLASKVEVFLQLYQQRLALAERVQQLESAEKARRDSDRRFHIMADNIAQLAWMARPDGHIFWYNRRWYEYTGTTPEQMEGWGWKSVHDPKVLPEVLERWTTSLAAGREFDMEFPLRGADGQFRRFLTRAFPRKDEDGHVLEWFGTNTDVTTLLETQKALQDSEQRFRQLAEAVPQIVFGVNLATGENYFNRRWTEFTGLEPGDLKARMELVHPDDRERVNGSWAHAIETGTAYECEYRFRRHDGQYHWMLARAVPFENANGRVTQWFGTATDVQDLKAAQEALAEADQRKTEFLAVLSHELRNPLAPIKNSLYVLDRAAPEGEQAIRAKEIIVRQVEQLANLVNDLLDVTRITRNKVRLHKENLEINEIVRRTAEDNRSLFERNQVELRIALAPTPMVVSADRTRLAQVISNLLQNSAKFTTSGGHTRISVEAGKGTVIVRVTDDGIGMVPATLKRLFQPFAQAAQSLDRSGGGLGLGLALVKGLVELHGGRVSARSEGLGKGSEFVLEIPYNAATNLPAVPVSSHASRAPRRILIIEDNRDAAESLREVLEFENHEVAVAHDGAQGLRMALEFRPEVVLCDIGLPGMDGYEVARALCADEHLRGVHLVALTGYALPEDLIRAREAGFQDHLAKPPSIERLTEILSRVAAAAGRA